MDVFAVIPFTRQVACDGDRGVARGAMIYSIVETARHLNLDPYRVVHALLKKLPAAKASEIEAFSSDN